MANSQIVTREDLKNVFEALGEGDYSTRIDALESHDYIVEQGTSGIWTYRKWNSGLAECWGYKITTVTATRSYGTGLYISQTNIPREDFPFTFVGVPMCSITLENLNGWIMYEGMPTETQTQGWWLVRVASTTNINACVSYIAKGRWK